MNSTARLYTRYYTLNEAARFHILAALSQMLFLHLFSEALLYQCVLHSFFLPPRNYRNRIDIRTATATYHLSSHFRQQHHLVGQMYSIHCNIAIQGKRYIGVAYDYGETFRVRAVLNHPRRKTVAENMRRRMGHACNLGNFIADIPHM